jgi:drug/metabolite transporter (DMT)-like permease
MALRGDEADAAGFTAVRLASGAAALVVISLMVPGPKSKRSQVCSEDNAPSTRDIRPWNFGSWLSALFLFAYAACFSFAYLNLTAAAGALVLFGSVQLTMIASGLLRGERPTVVEWLGIMAAFGGLVYLVLPGIESPPVTSSLLMAAAGVAWAGYTICGRVSGDPLADTTGNFVRTLPFVAVLAVVYSLNISMTARGVVLAVLSGALASGVGYAVWYAALRYHTSTRAAILQLSVPVIAAVLGVVLLAETADLRLLIAGVFTLGGIGIAIAGRRRSAEIV